MSIVITEPVTAGTVLLSTTLGDISIQLFAREAPKAVRNFIQLALEGYYDNCLFHRVVPGFIAQTGDPTNTGKGGESIYDEGTFEDEYNQRLNFNRRGLVGMANQGTKNSNTSQFFLTLDSTPELQNRNTLFGRVIGDTLFNLLTLNDIELVPGSDDKPLYPPMIKKVVVLENPFEDIVPRITPAERKEQDKAKREMKLERIKQKELGRRKGTKNAALLSFVEESEQEGGETSIKTKFLSSHDALDDPRLLKTAIEAIPPPPSLPVPSASTSIKRQLDATELPQKQEQKEEDKSIKLSLVVKPPLTPSDPASKLQAEIAAVSANLKLMVKRDSSPPPSSDNSKLRKKLKRVGPSLLELQRAKYSKGKQGKKINTSLDETMKELENFRAKILGTTRVATIETDISTATNNFDQQEEEEVGEEDFLGHILRFRKDQTLDRHSIDEYSTIDPLAKNTLSLEELKTKSDNSGGRKYAGERIGGNSRGGRGVGGGGGGERRGEERREGREGRGQFGEGERGPVGRSQTSSWKSDRIQGA